MPRVRAEGDRDPRATGVGRRRLPHRPPARDGGVGSARRARPRAVGRHRHDDGRLRRRDGAARPGRPVGGGRVAGPRDDRVAPAAAVRQRRTTRTVAASAGRGPGARRIRAHRTRRRLRRARHPDPRRAPRRRLAAERPQDVHLERGHRHVVRGDAVGAHRGRRRRPADVRELRRREGHAGVHDRPEDAGHRVARPRHARAVVRRRVGGRRAPRRRSRDGAQPVPADARGGAHLDRRALAQPHAGRARPGAGLRRPARAVRAADRQVPGHAVQARRHRHRARGGALAHVPCRVAPRQWGAVPQGGGDGEAQGQPAGHVGGIGSGADPRRPRLHARVTRGAVLLRLEGPRDRRGHQRDPAPRHRRALGC